jgi:hypothetical protein
MAKFVKFADAEIPTSGVAINQDVFINPEFVRVVRADPQGGAVIQLGSVGIHREFITAAARWIMEAKL